jgi:hypothetical protein
MTPVMRSDPSMFDKTVAGYDVQLYSPEAALGFGGELFVPDSVSENMRRLFATPERWPTGSGHGLAA